MPAALGNLPLTIFEGKTRYLIQLTTNSLVSLIGLAAGPRKSQENG